MIGASCIVTVYGSQLVSCTVRVQDNIIEYQHSAVIMVITLLVSCTKYQHSAVTTLLV